MKYPVFKKYYTVYKEMEKYGIGTGKKKLTKTVTEDVQIWDRQDKDFKSSLLNVLKKLKETMNKN